MSEIQEDYREWGEAIERISNDQGVTMILGGTDVGKSTFARLLLKRYVERKTPVAVIDADVGQSEVGPPACIGLAFADESFSSLSELKPHSLAFIGSVSPSHFLPEHISGLARLRSQAGGGAVVIDTPGYIQGFGARRLIQTEIDLLSPDHIVCLQRKEELQQIVQPFRRRTNIQLHELPIPSVIGTKTATFRTQRRAMRFASYFQSSVAYDLSFDEIAFGGTWLGGGEPAAAHLFQFISEVFGSRNRLYHAEFSGRNLGLMLAKPVSPDSAELNMIMTHFKTSELMTTVAPNLKNLLLGLEDRQGKLLGLGILVGLDFKRRVIKILSPLKASGAICKLRFGRQRVRPDGTDAGQLKPEEC